MSDVARFVIHETFGQSQCCGVAIQRQDRDMDDLAVRVSPAAADAHLYAVPVAQDGGQQRQAVEYVFLTDAHGDHHKPMLGISGLGVVAGISGKTGASSELFSSSACPSTMLSTPDGSPDVDDPAPDSKASSTVAGP